MSHVVLFEIDFLQTSSLTSMHVRFDTDVEEEMPKNEDDFYFHFPPTFNFGGLRFKHVQCYRSEESGRQN